MYRYLLSEVLCTRKEGAVLIASNADLEQFITHTQAGQPGRASPRRGRHSENSVVTKQP